MNHDELKRLAEAAKAEGEWFEEGCALYSYYDKTDADFMVAASPATILALIAENESLRDLYQVHRQMEERQMRDLRAEIEELLERAEYWKQRAKSAEGHLFTSDWRAARHALHMHTALASTPWDALTDAQKTQISSAAGAVIAEVNTRREVRMPHDAAMSTGERDQPCAEVEALHRQVDTLTEWYANSIDTIERLQRALLFCS